jgi:hypothetical protein
MVNLTAYKGEGHNRRIDLNSWIRAGEFCLRIVEAYYIKAIDNFKSQLYRIIINQAASKIIY